MAWDDHPLLDGAVLPRVIAAGMSCVGPGAELPEHELDYHEIDFVSRGSTALTLNGEAGVIGPGMVGAYRPGDVAHGRITEELVCRWVRFSWPATRGRAAPVALPRVRRLSDAAQARLVAPFDRLIALHATSPGTPLATTALLIDVLAVVVDQHDAAPARIDRRLAPGVAYLSANLARPLRIRDAAAACGLSEDWFSRRFRRVFGVPPMQHLVRLRLDEARRLLVADPLLPVAEAAKRCGFDDPGHFTRLFRRRHGLAPSAFRSRLDGR
ncbi:MAG TPA: AraC family transcriptional regulator [Planctomycetota bacterium]|nr:AraC family transcriptional regulator [Planctomycetota bacterium]